MGLLSEWKQWKEEEPPHMLEADREVLSKHAKRWTAQKWDETYQAPNFGKSDGGLFHLGLLPLPFVGDLQSATIFVLMLNPGLGMHDYYGEYEVPEYKNALRHSLAQDFPNEENPFLFLRPRFAWHGGFGWWQSKLGNLVEQWAGRNGKSFADARMIIGRQLAAIELVPYHSTSFNNAGNFADCLPSARLAKEFVRDMIIPRVESREAIAIVTRRAKDWGLKEGPGVIVYDQHRARGAHLGPSSPGGKAILQHLENVL